MNKPWLKCTERCGIVHNSYDIQPKKTLYLMTKVIFTGYFNISFLFASVNIPIIVMYGHTDGVENRIIFLFCYSYNIFSSKISKENLD